MYLSLYSGDSPTFEIPLKWAGQPFIPGDDWGLIFTAKYRDCDEDEEAIFQKASGVGITATGSTASVSLVSEDTKDLDPFSGVWDIRAQHVTNGTRRTVARDVISVSRPVGTEEQTSVPIHTTDEPAPYGGGIPADGTGLTDPENWRELLELDQVDNTSDADKPISEAAQEALNNRMEWVSVKNFGAVGNGVNDDTVAIQAAADTGKNVYFPAGKYKITSKINLNHIGATTGVPVIKGQKFAGDGPARSIIYQATSSAHIFDVTQASSMYLQVDCLGFEGTGGNSSTGYGIRSSTGPGPHNSWRISNCYFYWLNKGIGAGLEDSIVENCTFDSCVVGIDMMSAGGAAINQNTLYNNIIVYQTGSKYPTVPGIGIRVNGGYGHKIIGLDMGNQGMVTAIELNGNSGGEISGMSTEMFPYTGQLVSCINGTNAGFSVWSVSNSNLIGFGTMNAGDYPIVQGRFVTMTVNNVAVSGSWTAGAIKRAANNELVTCPLHILGTSLKVDVWGSTLQDSYYSSPFNEAGAAAFPVASASNKGTFITRGGRGGGDDEFFRSSQRFDGTYGQENLLQYGTDSRAGRFSQLDYVTQSVSGVTATADSSFSTNTPDRVLDGNTGTEWWHNGPVNTGSPFLKFDFGVGNAPKITKLLFHNTTVAVLNVVAQGSNDNSTWTTIGGFRKYAVGSSQHLINPTIGYRYYRLNFSSTDTAWLQVAEVGFFRSVVTGDHVGSGAGLTGVPLSGLNGLGAGVPAALALSTAAAGGVQLNNGSGAGLTGLTPAQIAGTAVTLAGVETLTNKTISAADNTLQRIPMTVSNDSDFSTTSTTFVNVTGMSFPMLANKNYQIVYCLFTNKTDANGMRAQFTGPASPTKVLIRPAASVGSVNALVAEVQTAFSTESQTFNNFNGDGIVNCAVGYISNGANAGTVQLQLRAVTGGTAKIYAGSWIQITQLN